MQALDGEVKPRKTRKVNPYKVYVDGGPIAFSSGQIGKCKDWIQKHKVPGPTYSIRKDFGSFKVLTTTKEELVEA